MFSKRILTVMMMAMVLALGLAACGGGGDSSSGGDSGGGASQPEPVAVSLGDADAGETQYEQLCIACHGPQGVGVDGLGKPFTTSDFVLGSTDEEMLTFIKNGRPISDPANTTGVDMPPKGGNPALTDDQILDIIAYIRTLHE